MPGVKIMLFLYDLPVLQHEATEPYAGKSNRTFVPNTDRQTDRQIVYNKCASKMCVRRLLNKLFS